MDGAPLILTVVLDDESQRFFDDARQRWFPPELNYLPAHLTLFHHLPGEQLVLIRELVATICADHAPVTVSVTGVRSLGRGVAYSLAAPEIALLRSRIALRWQEDLTAQDRQPWRPHVTVQNKVSPAEARNLLALLSRDFIAFTATVAGIAIWRYRGGPWEKVAVELFRG